MLQVTFLVAVVFVKSTTTLVSIGTQLLTITTNKEHFFKRKTTLVATQLLSSPTLPSNLFQHSTRVV